MTHSLTRSHTKELTKKKYFQIKRAFCWNHQLSIIKKKYFYVISIQSLYKYGECSSVCFMTLALFFFLLFFFEKGWYKIFPSFFYTRNKFLLHPIVHKVPPSYVKNYSWITIVMHYIYKGYNKNKSNTIKFVSRDGS